VLVLGRLIDMLLGCAIVPLVGYRAVAVELARSPAAATGQHAR